MSLDHASIHGGLVSRGPVRFPMATEGVITVVGIVVVVCGRVTNVWPISVRTTR